MPVLECRECGKRGHMLEFEGFYFCYKHHPSRIFKYGVLKKPPRKVIVETSGASSNPANWWMTRQHGVMMGVYTDVRGIPKRSIEKMDRFVDAKLGRKKRKPAKKKKPPRDRRYVR